MTGTPMLSVSVLEQWELFGGHRRLIEISERQVTVELCACTGESLQCLQTHDPETIQYLHGAEGSPEERW